MLLHPVRDKLSPLLPALLVCSLWGLMASAGGSSAGEMEPAIIALHFLAKPDVNSPPPLDTLPVAEAAYIQSSEVLGVTIGRTEIADFSAGAPTTRTIEIPQIVLRLSKSGGEKMKAYYRAAVGEGFRDFLVVVVDGKPCWKYFPSSGAGASPEKIVLYFADKDLDYTAELEKIFRVRAARDP